MTGRSFRLLLVPAVVMSLTGARTALASTNEAAPTANVPATTAQRVEPEPPATPAGLTPGRVPAAVPSAKLEEQRKEIPDLTPEIIGKLSPEQLTEIFIAHEREENGGWTPVAGAIGVFTFLLGSVLAICYVALRRGQLRHQTLQAAIEKGLLTREMLMPVPADRIDLRRGLLFVGGGAGLSVMLGLSPLSMFAGAGAIPALIGAGYLIAWRVAHGRTPDEVASDPG